MAYEHLSMRLPEGTREKADALIPLLRGLYPAGVTVTRQTVLRDALLRGLVTLEEMARRKVTQGTIQP